MYYWSERDFYKLYSLWPGVTVYTILHRPVPVATVQESMARALPQGSPEFVWATPKSAPDLFCWQDRVRDFVRGNLYGEPLIKMVPLAEAGTTYTHDAMLWLGNGGKHISVFTMAIDMATTGHLGSILVAAIAASVAITCGIIFGLMAWAGFWTLLDMFRNWRHLRRCRRTWGVTSAIVCPALTMLNPTAEWDLLAIVAAFAIAALPFLAAVAMRYLTLRTTSCGIMTVTTVHAIPKTVIADQRGEAIADVYHVKVGHPTNLCVPQSGAFHIAPQALSMAIPAFLLGGDTDATANRAVANIIRRHDVTINAAASTVQYARTLACMVASGNGSLPSGLKGRSTPSRGGSLSIRLFVWAAQQLGSRMVLVSLCLALVGVLVSWSPLSGASHWWE